MKHIVERHRGIRSETPEKDIRVIRGVFERKGQVGRGGLGLDT